MRNRLFVTVQTYWFHHFAPIFKEFSNLKLFSLISQFLFVPFCLYCKHQLNSVLRFLIEWKRQTFSENAKIMDYFVIFLSLFLPAISTWKRKVGTFANHFLATLITLSHTYFLLSKNAHCTIRSNSFWSRIRVFTRFSHISS